MWTPCNIHVPPNTHEFDTHAKPMKFPMYYPSKQISFKKQIFDDLDVEE